MSRTYRFRNKDNKPNRYIKDYFSFSSFSADTREEKEENEEFIRKYMSGRGMGLTAPKFYRRFKNKKEKRSFEEHMKRCLVEGREDEILPPKHFKDACYDWF